MTHICMLLAGLIAGVILNPPVLLLIILAMLAIALYIRYPSIPSLLQAKGKPD